MFFIAFVFGIRLYVWNTNPIFLFLMLDSSLSAASSTFIPSKKYSPDVGLSKTPIIFINVDFPEPDGPTMDTNSPSSTFKDIPCKISNSFGWPI